MVDITFPVIILFGGLIVGLIASIATGAHGRHRFANLAAGAVGGWAGAGVAVGTPLLRSLAQTAPEWGPVAGDLLWWSPVIGGFAGVILVWLVRRFGLGIRREATFARVSGEILMTVGGVLTVISLLMTAGMVSLYFTIRDHGMEQLPVDGLLADLLPGLILLGAGYLVVRFLAKPVIKA